MLKRKTERKWYDMKKLWGTAVILLLAACLLIGCGKKKEEDKTGGEASGKHKIEITVKDYGTIEAELDGDIAPITVANFLKLAEEGFYDGLTFHRIIDGFMIQGGDPKGNGTGGPGYKFPDEFVDGLIFDKPGKLAMANSGSNTNGSQFFITHVPTDWLNYKHTIFGEVVTGQEVVDSVEQNDTIKSITIVRQGEEAKNFSATQKDFDSLIEAQKKLNEEREAKKMAAVIEGCEKTENGIYFKIEKKGNGKKVGSGKKVSVEYKGYLVDGTLFDASKDFYPQGHEPLEFTTGAGQMIKGFDQMVQEMEYEETRHMVLPPELAYGSQGYPGVIPGNAYICFDVKVVK